jgi:type II secretory ATPase GspE/PulE/Tfp pilus assembly ATPase PilB-like protein
MDDEPDARIITRLHELGLDHEQIEQVLSLVNSNRLEPEPEPESTPQEQQQTQDEIFLQQLRGSQSNWTSVDGMW